eukprot:g4087.t1
MPITEMEGTREADDADVALAQDAALKRHLDDLDLSLCLTRPIAGDYSTTARYWQSQTKADLVKLEREPTMHEMGLLAIGDVIPASEAGDGEGDVDGDCGGDADDIECSEGEGEVDSGGEDGVTKNENDKDGDESDDEAAGDGVDAEPEANAEDESAPTTPRWGSEHGAGYDRLPVHGGQHGEQHGEQLGVAQVAAADGASTAAALMAAAVSASLHQDDGGRPRTGASARPSTSASRAQARPPSRQLHSARAWRAKEAQGRTRLLGRGPTTPDVDEAKMSSVQLQAALRAPPRTPLLGAADDDRRPGTACSYASGYSERLADGSGARPRTAAAAAAAAAVVDMSARLRLQRADAGAGAGAGPAELDAARRRLRSRGAQQTTSSSRYLKQSNKGASVRGALRKFSEVAARGGDGGSVDGRAESRRRRRAAKRQAAHKPALMRPPPRKPAPAGGKTISEETLALQRGNFKLSYFDPPVFHSWNSTARGVVGGGRGRATAAGGGGDAGTGAPAYAPVDALARARELLRASEPATMRGHMDGVMVNLPISDADKAAARESVARAQQRWSGDMQEQCCTTDRFHFAKRDEFKEYVEAQIKFGTMAGAKAK